MLSFPNAKINLGLFVIEKREDGYHNIESVFMPTDLKDILEVIKSDEFEFIQTGQKLDCDIESNLVVKAYRLLEETYNLPPVKVHLHKVIPSGAGLGGGSADAAFMINALNDLFELNISIEKRKQLASRLGSDCSFFIENKSAFVTGVGHDMEEIDLDVSNYQLVIVNPGIHISTPFAYGKVIPKKPAFNLKEHIQTTSVQEWREKITNDFEEPMINEFPRIGELKNKMYDLGAIYTSMTGSGSTLFGFFEKDARINFQKEFEDCFVWYGN